MSLTTHHRLVSHSQFQKEKSGSFESVQSLDELVLSGESVTEEAEVAAEVAADGTPAIDVAPPSPPRQAPHEALRQSPHEAMTSMASPHQQQTMNDEQDKENEFLTTDMPRFVLNLVLSLSCIAYQSRFIIKHRSESSSQSKTIKPLLHSQGANADGQKRHSTH